MPPERKRAGAKRGRPPVETRPDFPLILEKLLTRPLNKSAISRDHKVSDDVLLRIERKYISDPVREALDRTTPVIVEAMKLDALAALSECATTARRMLVAADEWLRDPEHSAKYNLNPRTNEIEVVIEETVGKRTRRVTRPMSQLLQRIEDKLGVDVIKGESKVADPRKLLLEAVATLKPVAELLGKATGQIKTDPVLSLNVFLSSNDWQLIEGALVEALEPYPEARAAAGRVLSAVAEDDDGA